MALFQTPFTVACVNPAEFFGSRRIIAGSGAIAHAGHFCLREQLKLLLPHALFSRESAAPRQ
jgi:hypothetical protein